jgi:3-dehydro-L-gulonate 2-dehydrogenase
MGCVGLRYTNHWMRGGAYGWRAAEAGFILICWTNATGGMAPWGAAEARLGNNPLVLAIPRKDGPVVLDMALTQFSHGRLDIYLRSGRTLPVAGGFDRAGNLTRDAAAIAKGGRHLPIGCWKGSGLALLLDVLGAIVSGGLTTCQIRNERSETRVSQVFIAFDPARSERRGGAESVEALVNQALDDLHAAKPLSEEEEVLYPGERALRCRRESLALGVPVDPEIWQEVLAL